MAVALVLKTVTCPWTADNAKGLRPLRMLHRLPVVTAALLDLLCLSDDPVVGKAAALVNLANEPPLSYDTYIFSWLPSRRYLLQPTLTHMHALNGLQLIDSRANPCFEFTLGRFESLRHHRLRAHVIIIVKGQRS
jgi:hypothetical protein